MAIELCAAAARAIAGMARSGTILGVILRLLRSCLRRVFNLSFLAALSLLLFVGLGCLWVRSMWVLEDIRYTRSSNQSVTLGTVPGGLLSILDTPRTDSPTSPIGWHYGCGQLKPENAGHLLTPLSEIRRLGFTVDSYDFRHSIAGSRVTRVMIPLWFPMVLTLIAPLCWLRRWRRRARRVRLGLCFHCGYDLRATPDSTGPRVSRCPECGRESS